MLKWSALVLCSLVWFGGVSSAEPPKAILVVLTKDKPSAESLSSDLIAARDRAHISENQLQVRRMLVQGWSPQRFQQLGISERDLPLAGVARYSPSGKFLGVVGYPDFVERRVSDGPGSSDRLVRRWADANAVAMEPAQPLIRATTVVPELKDPLPIGAEFLVSVQAESGGVVLLNSSSNRSVTLPEAGGGLYQGMYVVNPDEKGDIALIAHYSNAKGASQDKPVGHFQAIGWVAPQITAVNPIGADIYQVIGSAPPGSLVNVKCHIDMGRFLFIGYSDYDQEWTAQTDDKGQFAFNMDLKQAETRRSGIDLEAKFTLYAQNPENEKERTDEVQFSSTVRMTYQNSAAAGYYGGGWGGYRSGFSFGLGYPGYYGRYGRFGPWW